MKKIILGFCALMTFMNAKAQVLEIWKAAETSDGVLSRELYCQGPQFSAEVYTQTNGTNTVDVKQGNSTKRFENNSTSNNMANRKYFHVRVLKTNVSKCLFGTIPTDKEGIDLGQRVTLGEGENAKTYKVLWAPYNLGGTDESKGSFFAWGELTRDGFVYDADGKCNLGGTHQFNSTSYQTPGVQKLDKEHDIAYQWWNNGTGGELVNGVLVDAWRIPTENEFQWLVDNGTWTSTVLTLSGARTHYLITVNGKSIYLQKNGYYNGGTNDDNGAGWTGIADALDAPASYYLTSDSQNNSARVLKGYRSATAQVIKVVSLDPYLGCNIRPVKLVPAE